MVVRDSGELRTEGAVEELIPHMGGKWVVQTQGTLHVWDLDEETYERRQHDGLNPMRSDREVVDLPPNNVITWPKVGEVFHILIEVDSYDGYGITSRRSSLIRSITPYTEEDDAGAE